MHYEVVVQDLQIGLKKISACSSRERISPTTVQRLCYGP